MNQSKRKLNIGVFGGYRGYTMMKVLFNHPSARLAAVCDKYEPLLDKVKAKADELGIEVACYNNFEDFIVHPELTRSFSRTIQMSTASTPFAVSRQASRFFPRCFPARRWRRRLS